MRVSQPIGDEASKRDGRSFGDALNVMKENRAVASFDFSASSFSGGGLPAPDGYTSDPFPPSLAAYVEVIRSVVAYLREQGMISGGDAKTVIDKVAPPPDVNDVDEPTTFAIGEEDHDCAAPAGTPAIGEAART